MPASTASASVKVDTVEDAGEKSDFTCQGCQMKFPSRNAMFAHLKKTKAACLSPEDYNHYLQHVQSKQRVKSVILYGYFPSYENGETGKMKTPMIKHGDDAALILMDVLFQNITHPINTDKKYSRSFGNDSRSIETTRQDDGSGALTEVICTKIPPLNRDQTVDDWIESTNQLLDHRLQEDNGMIKIFGRTEINQSRFNAEVEMSHCRMQYLLPIDFLYPNKFSWSRNDFRQQFPSFDSFHGDQTKNHKTITLDYLLRQKKTMQLLITGVVDLDPNDKASVQEKKFHNDKRKRLKRKNDDAKQERGKSSEVEQMKDFKKIDIKNSDNSAKNVSLSKKSQKLLRRRRFHNFTPRVMAHEYLSFRRLDRFYHRGTVFHEICNSNEARQTFFALGLTGDLFLHGQVCRIVGLFVALMRGVVEEDFVDCIFDEDYPDLVPAPPVPPLGLYMGEASYVKWEGKSKTILSPRPKKNWSKGFNDIKVLRRVQKWEEDLHHLMAGAWIQEGVDNDGRLTAERLWTERILEPWSIKANEQLLNYRQWKFEQKVASEASEALSNLSSSCLHSLDKTVPHIFEAVLHHLRKADSSGLWPTTTPKRQLVMISTTIADGEKASASLSMAHMKARTNEGRSSAYAFSQGQGGASGSFSVGGFPSGQQPRANELFPELSKAAFELEQALMPNREPSSTIAINRNAQFRPHTDSGAGAGQSTSLIVGLGNYIGGDLVVEGDRKDIRYKAIEFNGWTQRHWTMPFQGERFSLVWFTPKGCEGVHGIDLFQN